MILDRVSFDCYTRYYSMESHVESKLAHVFVNFSKRTIKIVDDEGYDKTVNWKWDNEGSEGFSETVRDIEDILDPDMITYSFAVQ